MPDPVLGGATLLMFGTVASAGVKIIASQITVYDGLGNQLVSCSIGMNAVQAVKRTEVASEGVERRGDVDYIHLRPASDIEKRTVVGLVPS